MKCLFFLELSRPWAIKPEGGRPFPPMPKSPSFFQASEGVVVLLLDQVAAEYAVAFAETLLEASGAMEVLFLDRLLRSECAQPRPEEPHLTGLWSTTWPRLQLPLLKAPNVVQGLAAAVLSGCEARGLPCLTALSLQDGAHLSEACLRAFEGLVPVFEELKVVSGWRRVNYREALQKLIPPASMSIYA